MAAPDAKAGQLLPTSVGRTSRHRKSNGSRRQLPQFVITHFNELLNHVDQERYAPSGSEYASFFSGFIDASILIPVPVIPFQIPPAKESSADISGTLGSTLPMAAMFTRNKFVGWASVVLAVQNWLGESQEAKRSSSQPAYFSVGMGIMALVVTYLPMFLPPPTVPGTGTGTEAPAAAPLS
ncbi:uncharacterized protein RAG0_07022 [Rhynchosporium agropyri]|uniref:Uncharacterized protein n=1 Tax=Rhynchosporium agropyri TaxID=914238 RepID=A0A1E1KJN5_9HELO|nr:uncharacterized protein RAG0_07022 [Rhynchosporium agropyri]